MSDAPGPLASLTLPDGRAVPYRAIHPEDATRLQAFHRGLSERTRYQRFFGYYPELGDRQADHFVNVDGHDRLALVALEPDDPTTIIGVVRLDRHGGADDAEYAAVVTDRWQGLGVGYGLTLALLDRARSEGIRRVYALVLPENQAMLTLLKDLGRPWRVTFDDNVHRVEIDLLDSEEDAS
jgi:RimJ/RimL family protein N-acetyltransferase